MLSQCIINAKHLRRKSTLVYKRNRKQHVLAVIVGFFAAIPVICLPIGIRAGVSPALIISKAYAQVFGIQEGAGTIVEAQDIVGEGVVLADVSNGTFDTGAQAAAAEQEVSYSDVPKYIVYQEYDQSNLPIELLDVQCFAADNTTYYIRANNSILKEIPNMDSYTICTLHLGQEVTRIGIGDTWSKIQTEDGQEGYVLTDSIQDTMLEISIDRTVWVDTDSLIVRAEPSTSSEEVTVVNQDAKLYCSAIVGDKWYKVKTTGGKSGYVYKSYTTTNPPPTPTPTPTPRPRTSSSSGGGGGGSYGDTRKLPKITGCNGESIVSLAESMLGKPYVFGGTTSSGVDCAGLVTYCYAQVGISVANGSNTIYKSYGVSVPRSDLKPGDVICYDYGGWCGHVAIYIGDGQVIHASASKGVVKYGVLDMMGIIAIKRFIQ